MERSQFTFYESFYKALSHIKDTDRAKTYDAICRFALYGEEPELSGSPAAIFEVIKPVLVSSRRKSLNGKKGGESKSEAKRKQNGSKSKARESQKQVKEQVQVQDKVQVQEKEEDKDKEQMLIPPIVPQGTFDQFWKAYPKKVGKQDALKAFKKIKGVPVETMIAAIEQQKHSRQWQENNGQYIPNPATWLNQGRWEDELEEYVPKSSNPFKELLRKYEQEEVIVSEQG